MAESGPTARPAFVLHEHRGPRHHFDLRLEPDGVRTAENWLLHLTKDQP